MKKLILIPLLFTACVSADDHIYAGGSLSIQNNTELDALDLTVEDNNELGFNLITGYNLALTPYLDLGFELEHQIMGKLEFNDSVSVKGDATYINVRPKFIEEYNNLYSSFIFGIGKMKAESTIGNSKTSANGTAYQVGIEAGYMLNNFDIGIGYRYQMSEFKDTDITLQGFNLGLRYNFQ